MKEKYRHTMYTCIQRAEPESDIGPADRPWHLALGPQNRRHHSTTERLLAHVVLEDLSSVRDE